MFKLGILHTMNNLNEIKKRSILAKSPNRPLTVCRFYPKAKMN